RREHRPRPVPQPEVARYRARRVWLSRKPSSGLLLAPEVGDVLLTARVGQHRHQFPTVLAPLVENLLGRVDQQRNRGVLPFGHVETLSRALNAAKGDNPDRKSTR